MSISLQQHALTRQILFVLLHIKMSGMLPPHYQVCVWNIQYRRVVGHLNLNLAIFEKHQLFQLFTMGCRVVWNNIYLFLLHPVGQSCWWCELVVSLCAYLPPRPLFLWLLRRRADVGKCCRIAVHDYFLTLSLSFSVRGVDFAKDELFICFTWFHFWILYMSQPTAFYSLSLLPLFESFNTRHT